MNNFRQMLQSTHVTIRGKVFHALHGAEVLTITELAKKAGVEYSEAAHAARWLAEREYFSMETSEGNYIVARGPRQWTDDSAFASGEAPIVQLPRARSSPRSLAARRASAQPVNQEMNVVAGVQVTIQGRNFTLTFAEADKLFRLLQKVFPGAQH